MPRHFSKSLFSFMTDLAENNDRDWFTENKERYLEEVRDPMLAFIADFAPKLAKISPNLIADPRPNGGSMFRIYRDVRFSKDKRPYKTAATAQFRHRDGKDVHAPGYYLHLEPGEVFVGAGIWRPDGPSVNRIRAAIDSDPARWKRVTTTKAFRESTSLTGDSLKRPPRGYAADHPLIDDLRRKDFICVTPLTQKQVLAPDFLATFTATCRGTSPLMQFLADAVELDW